MRSAAVLALASVFFASCDSGDLPSTCSGHAELCDRRYDQVAFATTHNSMADTDRQVFAAVQTHDIEQQLADGIRGLMIDTHYDPVDGTTVAACHGVCLENYDTLAFELGVITGFLREHRDAIVTIIFESYVSADDTAAVFASSGALDFTYAHVRGEPWPTLHEMIAADQRLVVFTDSEGGNETTEYPWYMDQWAYAFQNPYAAETDADFSCDVDRGTDSANSVFIMNHFLTAPFGSIELASMVNPYASLHPHVETCRSERGRIPNFVTVDFYEVGDLFRVVDELNGVAAAP